MIPIQLLDYLPKRHHSTLIGATQQAIQPLADAEQQTRDDILAQLWPDTATWGLAAWEIALGLETPAESYEVRRSRITAKLRGFGSVTPALMQTVAESYTRGEITVVEVPRAYKIVVTFVNQIGRPVGVESLMEALNELVPAHLAMEYIWRYRTWAEISGKTWGQLAGITWQEAKEGAIP